MTLSTQQRVIETSARLFNRHGVEGVSIGQICEDLAISPGNFTYHYRRKADLIRDHFNLLEARLTDVLDTFPVPGTPESFAAALYALMELVVGYRFLFLGASYCIKNRLISAARYRRMVEHARRRVIAHIERLIALRYLAPVAEPYAVGNLVDSLWWQWLGWLLTMQITPPKAVSSPRLVTDALINIILFNQHYAEQDFFRDVRREVEAIGRARERA
jgi:AcrR family transcriptional regulator